MHRFFPSHRVALSVVGLALAAATSSCDDGNVLGIDAPSCQGAKCSNSGTGGAGKSGSGGASATGGRQGNGLPTGGSGGKSAASGSGGTGGSAGADDRDGSVGVADANLAPLPEFTLVVDAPNENASVSATVTIVGRAPGFLNVEVWDDAHQMPPLAQGTPDADGNFSIEVSTASLAAGALTWTVYAWDSAPGEDFMHTASVTLHLTLSAGDAGVTDPGAIGSGDIDQPVDGPAPVEMGKVGGDPFVLVKNWDFGSDGTITDVNVLISEFQFHDNFGTIANGTNYGSVTVAPNAATAVDAPNLGLPGNKQPIEDPAHPMREFSADALKTYVRPLDPADTTCKVSDHDTGNGSITAKWRLPNGGSLLGKDLLWETRVRMPKPLAGYWFAIWTVGDQWNNGAEMDVMESFGSANVFPPPTAFHVDPVGGTGEVDYGSWPAGLTAAHVPSGDARDLSQWHTFTWVYRKDDTYTVYFDGYDVQRGTIHWTNGGGQGATPIDMSFVFDFGWGQTTVGSVKDISLPCSDFPMTYELDYSRVYLRE